MCGFSVPPPRSRAASWRGSALRFIASTTASRGESASLGSASLGSASGGGALVRERRSDFGAGGAVDCEVVRRILEPMGEGLCRGCIAPEPGVDVDVDVGLDPYRGCEYGCLACGEGRDPSESGPRESGPRESGPRESGAELARLGFSEMGPRGRVLIRADAPKLLHAELSRESWQPRPIALGAGHDAYLPAEKHFGLTRRCLQVLAEFRNPVSIVTKSPLVARDLDLLRDLADRDLAGNACARVRIHLGSLNARLAQGLAPRAASPGELLHTIHRLAESGVPVGIHLAPLIPGLNEQEMPALLEAAAGAGAQYASYAVLRPSVRAAEEGAKESAWGWLDAWLAKYAGAQRRQVLARMRDLHRPVRATVRGSGAPSIRVSKNRGGQRNMASKARRRWRPRPTERPYALHLDDLFRQACDRAGLAVRSAELSAAAFRPRSAEQLSLF